LGRGLAESWDLGNVRFTVADALDIPRPSGTYDFVLSDGLIQYLQPTALLNEVHRVLDPRSGRAVVVGPNGRNLPLVLQFRLLGGDGYGSSVTFSRRSMRRHALAANFDLMGWDGYLPPYAIERLSTVFRPESRMVWRVTRLVSFVVRVADRFSRRVLSRRYGFALAMVLRPSRPSRGTRFRACV
jgi:hypothetical protein